MTEIISDILVIGSGISGLFFSIKAQQFANVTIITKRKIWQSNTYYAQGGIAVVTSKDDSFQSHINDTLKVGEGICKENVVKMVIESAPERIKELTQLGVNFSKNTNEETGFDLGLEGGHSFRRIIHAGDFTGREIEKKLVEIVKKLPNIKIFEDYVAIDLITERHLSIDTQTPSCFGAYALNTKTNQVETFLAKMTVLATGGAGKVYLYTSNPDTSTGDGLAMAYRAGATLANLEFVQFHPTCLYHPQAKSFLISETVRGEGGILKTISGERFMKKYHPKEELAPRDIVARAIDNELKISGDDFVYLDISHKGEEFFKNRFPQIYEKCISIGINPGREAIPVIPAAHYFCGGVSVDEYGKTDVKNLFAIGEVMCSGMHGANRLGSNSLLECLVFAHNSSVYIEKIINKIQVKKNIPQWNPGKARNPDEMVIISQNWDEIRRFMWNYVSNVKSNKRLERAHRRIILLNEEIQQYYWDFYITQDLIELRNIALVAGLIIESAMLRKESRGAHYNIDYPKRDDTNFKKFTLLNKFYPSKL